jgi:hypothetical protein
MKIPWSGVFAVVKAVYIAFFKGRIINLPGGIGPITLPQRDHTVPLGLVDATLAAKGYTSELPGPAVVPTGFCPGRGPIRQAHVIPAGETACTECGIDFAVTFEPKPLPLGMELPRDERRAPPPPRRADSLPDTVPPSIPLNVHTFGIVLFIFFGFPIIALTVLGILEWRTLSDDIPGNHITATMRAAWRRAPGAVFLATLLWVGFLVAIGFGLAVHFWFV